MTDSTTDRRNEQVAGTPPNNQPPENADRAASPEAPTATRAAGAGKRYQRWRIRLAMTEWLATVCLLCALVHFGVSVAIRQFAERYASNPWLVILIYLLPVGALLTAVSMLFSAVRTFILDRRFGLSTQRAAIWLADEVKGVLVGGILGLLVIETFYALMRRFPDVWWLWASVTFGLLVLVFAHLAPVFIFPLFFKFTPITDNEIAERLRRLARLVGTRVKGIYEFNLSRKTRAANAALVGFGRTRRIVLADTLLDNFTLGEIEVVMAHEFGHHTLYHLPKIMVLQTVSLFLFFFCLGSILGGPEDAWPLWGFRGSTDIANFPLVVLVVMFLGLLTLPVMNGLLRRFERRADDFALETASEPRSFCSAFQRLAQLNLADVSPNPLVELLFHSHPSIGKRVARAEAILRDRGVPVENARDREAPPEKTDDARGESG